MGAIKVVIEDDVERRFRRVAMSRYGYGKGALSEAAEAALSEWSSNEDTEVEVPDFGDPVTAIEGLLRHVGASSVELQHEATKIRVKRSRAKAPS